MIDNYHALLLGVSYPSTKCQYSRRNGFNFTHLENQGSDSVFACVTRPKHCSFVSRVEV